MTTRDCFGIVVRSLGLIILLLGAFNVFSSLFLPFNPDRLHRHIAVGGLVYACFFGLVGLYLLRGASGLVRFSYPSEPATRAERAEALEKPPAT